eukprot:362129-Chlamydomonas_euryale.AAC.3
MQVWSSAGRQGGRYGKGGVASCRCGVHAGLKRPRSQHLNPFMCLPVCPGLQLAAQPGYICSSPTSTP